MRSRLTPVRIMTVFYPRAEIEDFFGQVNEANEILQVYLPLEMKVPSQPRVNATVLTDLYFRNPKMRR